MNFIEKLKPYKDGVFVKSIWDIGFLSLLFVIYILMLFND